MTLHWWMHWFWVTTLLTIIASSGRTSAAPPTAQSSEEIEEHHTDRRPKAIYITKTTKIATTRIPPDSNVTDRHISTTNQTEVAPNIFNMTESPLNWTAVEPLDNTTKSNSTTTEMPLSNATVPAPYANVTSQNTTLASKKPNRTRLDYSKDGPEGVSESRIVTEKPLSLETTYLQTRIPPNVESSRRVVDDEERGMDTGAIAGIAFAGVVLTALAGSTAFVLYRRRYLNKPQTLNDKISNPDSSGYLDDSTIRDNSEEMYSLDNDSFLNSLEAMTIQNYWTDTVKHTKL